MLVFNVKILSEKKLLLNNSLIRHRWAFFFCVQIPIIAVILLYKLLFSNAVQAESSLTPSPVEEFSNYINAQNFKGVIGELEFVPDTKLESLLPSRAVNYLALYEYGSKTPTIGGNGMRIRDTKKREDYILTARHLIFDQHTSELNAGEKGVLYFGHAREADEQSIYSLTGVKTSRKFRKNDDIVALRIPYSEKHAAVIINDIGDQRQAPYKKSTGKYYSISVMTCAPTSYHFLVESFDCFGLMRPLYASADFGRIRAA